MTTALQIAPCFEMTPVGLRVTGSPTFDEWQAVGATLQFLEGAIQFAIGDWLSYGERRWGEMYAQAVEETGRQNGTLRDYVWVASAVDLSLRKDNLRFEHHKAVAPLRLEDGTPDRIKQAHYLDLAVAQDLPASQLRTLIREAKQGETTTPHKIFDGVVTISYQDETLSFHAPVLLTNGAAYHVTIREA